MNLIALRKNCRYYEYYGQPQTKTGIATSFIFYEAQAIRYRSVGVKILDPVQKCPVSSSIKQKLEFDI